MAPSLRKAYAAACFILFLELSTRARQSAATAAGREGRRFAFQIGKLPFSLPVKSDRLLCVFKSRTG
jgi:hypothetical protein